MVRLIKINIILLKTMESPPDYCLKIFHKKEELSMLGFSARGEVAIIYR